MRSEQEVQSGLLTTRGADMEYNQSHKQHQSQGKAMKFTGKFIVRLLAVAVAAIIVVPVASCSSGSSGPPNAIDVLKSDGYTFDPTFTHAAQTGVGSQSAAAGMTSLAAGTKGNSVQIVFVFTSQALATAGASGARSQLGSSGVKVVSNGDVVTATGDVSSFSSVP